MPRTTSIICVILFLALTGCVSQKKFKTMKAEADDRYAKLDAKNKATEESLASCNRNSDALTADKKSLEAQLHESQKHAELYKENNTTMLKQLQSLSVVT